VGGFDERFPHFGEDTDLGLRLVGAGAVTAFAPAAVVHHRLIPMTYRQFLRRRYSWGQLVRLAAVNPAARGIFPLPFVAHRLHLAFWLAIPPSVWALRTGRAWVPLAGALAFGRRQARLSPTKGRSPVVATAYGVTELGGVAASALGFLVQSVRHRRLLL
jgi:GT2 family glycosyltransferase